MPEPKPVSQSRTTMSRIILPEDANPMGNVHGGIIIKFMDEAGGVAAMRHSRRPSVTVRADALDLKTAVYVGDIVTVVATVVEVGRTSMEVEVRVEAERYLTGEVVPVSNATLVFVALDDAGKPTPVPPLLVETEEEKRRQQEGRFRREHRQQGERAIKAWRQRRVERPELLLRAPGQAPFVVGHRGAAGHAPENTFASFERALEIGVDFVECDVHPCADGRLVVIHDPTVDRTTNGHGLVCEMTVEQLKALDAGSWFDPRFAGERLPLLSELLDWARGKVRVTIEAKTGPVPYEGLDRQLVREITEHRMLDQVAVISFDHPLLRQLKELEPAIATGALFAGTPVEAIAPARAALSDVIMPHHGSITPDLVAQAHAAGVGVFAWTPDRPEELHRLVERGVDGIITNYPDRLRAVIQETRLITQARLETAGGPTDK